MANDYRMILSSPEQILFRPARIEDVATLTDLQVSRYIDMTPNYPRHSEERMAWWKENGANRYSEHVVNAQEMPQQHFLHVATIGKTVVGFARAEAPPGDEFTWLRGLMVCKSTERRGVGSGLERIRQEWAARVNPARPLRGLIIIGNEASMGFFTRHGYRSVGIQEPTAEIPLRFTIMQLDGVS